MAGDPHRPIYHYVNPEGRLNDPNGLCFWQGRWHLFYQAYPPEDTRQHWGHAVSDDLIHWRDLPLAIYPNPEDKCFSGSTLVEEDRVIAIYHGIAAGTMVAVSSDPLLLNWEKVTGKAVIPLPKAGRSAASLQHLRSVHLEERRDVLRADGRHPARGAGRKAGPRRIPASLEGPGRVGVPAPVSGRRSIRHGRRRRRVPLLLADRRPAHPAALQPHERRQVPAGRLRHRARQVRGHVRQRLQFRAPAHRAACTHRRPAPTARAASSRSST